MGPPGLLFVHKNSSSESLSHSGRQETHEINRHVQRGRKHQRHKSGSSDRWHLPFLRRSNSSPSRTQMKPPSIIPRRVPQVRSSSDDAIGKITSKPKPPRAVQTDPMDIKVSKNSALSSHFNPEPAFQLVQYDPTNPSLDNTHAIRSNAVRYQWKRSKEVRPRGRKTKVPDAPDVSYEEALEARQNEDADHEGHSETLGRDARTLSSENKVLVKLPAPAQNGTLQPGGFPTELPSESVAPLLHLVYVVTSGTFVGDQAAARYVQQMRSHPASFHAAVWVCAKGMVDKSPVTQSTIKQRRFLDSCHNLAVNSVIQMITDLGDDSHETPIDELGMLCSAMQSLALGTTEDLPGRGGEAGPRQSTLTKLQNLHLWGIAPRWLNYHEEAARRILHANNCTDPFWVGLRICQTQNDIISSCRTLTRPRSPCWFINADFVERYNDLTLQMEPSYSPGFLKYAATLSPTLSGSLMSVISEAMLYDRIQAALLSNRLNQFGVGYVCDARNWTQHQIMSLPSNAEGDSLANQNQNAVVYNAVRHALVVYSLIAIFPLPLSSAPFPELAGELESAMSRMLEDGQRNTSSSLLLWIASMAALAAIGTPKRAPLVAFAADLCQSLRISSWESMQATLQDYLWSGEISDFDGIYLFLEAQERMFGNEMGALENGVS